MYVCKGNMVKLSMHLKHLMGLFDNTVFAILLFSSLVSNVLCEYIVLEY